MKKVALEVSSFLNPHSGNEALLQYFIPPNPFNFKHICVNEILALHTSICSGGSIFVSSLGSARGSVFFALFNTESSFCSIHFWPDNDGCKRETHIKVKVKVKVRHNSKGNREVKLKVKGL